MIADFDAKISEKRLNWYCLYTRVLFGYLNFGVCFVVLWLSSYTKIQLLAKSNFFSVGSYDLYIIRSESWHKWTDTILSNHTIHLTYLVLFYLLLCTLSFCHALSMVTSCPIYFFFFNWWFTIVLYIELIYLGRSKKWTKYFRFSPVEVGFYL